ncbi:hypothetical protein DSECCO2_599730 [anaerobic digester metagenome]
MQFDRILSIIDTIERGRREAKIEPICAPFIEIRNKCSDMKEEQLREALNKLYVDGRIKVWKGINDLIVQRV